jgi:uncharacterized protein
MHRSIAENRQHIHSLCRRFDVARLELFGSAARAGDFRPATSDIDFLVHFQEASSLPPLESFFGLRDELSALLGRPVDLVEAAALKNPYILADIAMSRELVYAA